jgi:UDP-glucose 4-epimerase
MDLMGVFHTPIRMPGRPQEVRTALCSSDKARRLLGYKTQTTLDEGLLYMIQFIRDRGAKPFEYHLPIEIVSPKTPATWTHRIF